MNINAIGDRVVLRIEKSNIKKIGDKELIIESNDKAYEKIFIDSIGDECTKKVEVGQEVILNSNCHAVFHPLVKDKIIVNSCDIYGIIED